MLIEWRNCCQAEREANGAVCFLNAVDDEPSHTTEPVRAVRVERPRDPAMAKHEAAHSVVGFILGFEIGPATLKVQPCAVVKWQRGISMLARIAMLLAGPTAQRWHDRHVYRAADAELLPFLERITAGTGGACDHCRAFEDAAMHSSVYPTTPLEVFRRAELTTIALVQQRSIWAAIRAIADLLMEHGTVEADTITSICNRHIDWAAVRPIIEELNP